MIVFRWTHMDRSLRVLQFNELLLFKCVITRKPAIFSNIFQNVKLNRTFQTPILHFV